jgi:hypothetical protein
MINVDLEQPAPVSVNPADPKGTEDKINMAIQLLQRNIEKIKTNGAEASP